MNTGEFNTELGKLVDRAVKEGVAAGKMDVMQLLGTMELIKGEVVRQTQDMARLARAQQQPRIHLPGKGF